MRHVLHILMLTGVVLVIAQPAVAQNIRMANGAIIKGEIKQVTDDGLVVQTPSETKTYTWETLSMATRFRYQPIYRANFQAILQGLSPASRTNRPEQEVSGQTVEIPPK